MIIRSLLFAPGHREDYIEKALHSEADVVVLDLEDAVPPKLKSKARSIVASAVAEINSNKPVFVRINDWGNGGDEDLEAMVTMPDGLVLPKVTDSDQITRVGWVNQLIILIETPEAVLKAYELAIHPGVVGLLFGVEDFLQYTMGEYGDNQQGLLVPRHLISIAAHAANRVPIDCPYTNVRDIEGLAEHIQRAKVLGFEGMLTLNLEQTKVANELYTPTGLELQDAIEMARAAEESEAKGRSVAVVNGKFVSPPTLKRAKRLIERHSSIMQSISGTSVALSKP